METKVNTELTIHFKDGKISIELDILKIAKEVAAKTKTKLDDIGLETISGPVKLINVTKSFDLVK